MKFPRPAWPGWRWLPGLRKRRAVQARQGLQQAAQQQYQHGNRHFEGHDWEHALESWRKASGYWRLAAPSAGRGWLGSPRLKAALALIGTLLLFYTALFQIFPRDSFDLFMMQAAGPEQPSWWDRFLNTGRPGGGQGHKMDIREWWARFKERALAGGQEGKRGDGSGRPSIEERWVELLRRHGRWGPLYNWNLDYHIVAGYGLSRLDEYDQAIGAFEKGIRSAKQPKRLADLYQGLANTHYNAGYRLQPDGLAEYNMALVAKSVKAYEQSVRYEKRALSLGNLGWMYFLQGNYARAEEYSQRALRQDRSMNYVRLNLGLVHLMQGRFNDAFNDYREVMRNNPPEDVYLGGINDLREVIRDNPGRIPYAHLMMGLLAIKSGDYSRANDALNRFMASPLIGSSWRALASSLLKQMHSESLER